MGRERNRHLWALRKRKQHAIKKGVPWDLEYDEVPLPPERCPCCGVRMRRGDNNGGRKTAPSLDRLIPERGYVSDNIVWICVDCNQTKNNAGPAELYRVADWLWAELKARNLPLPSTRRFPMLPDQTAGAGKKA